ncbi:MAG: 50S ribosomal protein L23 [Proteobacteria bacterium]|nr:50S ribosomal protein L23 [Pseudomonadota bacterium]
MSEVQTVVFPKRTARDIILRPIVTEKSVALSSENKYTFAVDPKANKIEIRLAIENIFKVKVLNVSTLNCKGKPKRWGRKYHGHKSDWKKAIVTVREGEKIEIAGVNLFEA